MSCRITLWDRNSEFGDYVGKLALDYSRKYFEAVKDIYNHPAAWGSQKR